MFFFGGGKCPNLGVVNVRILGVVNVLLANDSQSSVLVLNCPEIPGGGDCEHMGEEYVCLWGLDVCKGVLESSGLAW